MTAIAAAHAPLSAATSPPAVRPTLAEAAAIVAVRIGLWIGVQLLVAGIVVLVGSVGSTGPLNAAAGWWMVYGSAIDLATLALVLRVAGRHGVSYRCLLGPPAAAWQIGLGAAVVLVASVPAIIFSSELTSALYGAGATPPMLTIVDVPAPAAIYSATIWPILAELAEPVAYLGIILPALERWSGRTWLAASLVVGLWGVEHAIFPILLDGSGVDLVFAAYRVVSVLPFLAMWTALFLVFGRRLLPLMIGRWIFNGGTAVAVGLGLV
jgi:hypothetical protein